MFHLDTKVKKNSYVYYLINAKKILISPQMATTKTPHFYTIYLAVACKENGEGIKVDKFFALIFYLNQLNNIDEWT
jgi:hypothetical protein